MTEELENKLVEAYMRRNGWSYPRPGDDYGDYDEAVKDVKWFLARFKEADYVKLSLDQSLPENPHHGGEGSVLSQNYAYHYAQQDMLNAKFRKVELER